MVGRKNVYLLVVSSHVQSDWESLLWLDSSQGCVEGKLANRDTHAVDALKDKNKKYIKITAVTVFVSTLRTSESNPPV